MTDPKRYWRGVLALAASFCALAAPGGRVAPGVRSGTAPAIRGLVWHALGVIQLLVKHAYGPVAARVSETTAPWMRVVTLPALTGGSALLLSVVICLPFYVVGKQSSPAGVPSGTPYSSF
jgi:hypothetical protein